MNIAVVLGSSRRNRLGERVAAYVMTKAAGVPGADFSLLDLADYDLPFFDEELAPWSNPARSPAPAAARWLAGMAEADGYLFLTPEYNYAVPAVLKNALDFLGHEADGKPAAVLSYSDTRHGGNIAGHELRLTLSKLGMLPLPRSLPLAHADRLLDESGRLAEDSDWAAKVDQFVPYALAELARYAAALRVARDPVAS
jgi:NAD(P)H-dependent FMN reductase